MSGQPSPVLRRFAIGLAGMLASLLLLEWGLRLWYPQALYAVRYSYLGWSHVPRASFLHAGESREFVTHVHYNAHGLRDREYALEKPPGVRRVLLFGDSFAEGLEVELEQLHAKILERKLNDTRLGHRFEVLNFGVSAYDTAQSWWYLAKEGVSYHPDLVILLWTGRVGSNFAQVIGGELLFLEPHYTRREYVVRWLKTMLKSHSHLTSLLLDRMRMNRSLDDFLWTVRLGPMKQAVVRHAALLPMAGVVPVGEGPATAPTHVHWYVPADWRLQLEIFRAINRTCHAHHARFLIATLRTKWADAVRPALTGELGDVALVNLQQESDEEEERRYHYPVDGHYNPAGHAKAAQRLYEAIVQQHLLDVPP